MNRIVLGLAAVLFAGTASAFWAGPGLYIHNGTGVVTLKVVPFHGNAWMPYSGQPITVPGPTQYVEVPGPTVTIDNSTHTVEQQQVTQRGDPYGSAFAMLIATNFWAAICQSNTHLGPNGQDGFSGLAAGERAVADGDNGIAPFINEGSYALYKLCVAEEMSDPFESFTQ